VDLAVVVLAQDPGKEQQAAQEPQGKDMLVGEDYTYLTLRSTAVVVVGPER
jgi:hypothetical protein